MDSTPPWMRRYPCGCLPTGELFSRRHRLNVPCRKCGAAKGEMCRGDEHSRYHAHKERPNLRLILGGKNWLRVTA